MIKSNTKYEATADEIKELFRVKKIGEVVSTAPLGDGEFNAAYKVTCEDGSVYALKIAPPADKKVLTYEKFYSNFALGSILFTSIFMFL